jgi:hypothetical protein
MIHIIQQKKFGNTMVPQRYKDDPVLGAWVHTQRRQYTLIKEGKPSSMTQKKMTLLNVAGFVWCAKTNRSEACSSKSDEDEDVQANQGPVKTEETDEEGDQKEKGKIIRRDGLKYFV